MMMMSTIDADFTWEAPPYNQQKKKKSLKPTLKLYKKELRRHDPKERVSNKTAQELLVDLRGTYRLTDPADISFIKKKIEEYTETLNRAASEKAKAATPSGRSQSRKSDRMRFVECMALDSVKPLYLRVNEVMTRYEMDGRNSDNVLPDFYDRVSEEFNNPDYAPTSWYLPDLYDDFAVCEELLRPEDYTMTSERAKKMIATMKPKIVKLCADFGVSGGGENMLDKEEANTLGRFDVTGNTIEGHKISEFLQGESTDLLYWWHVLDEEGMLQYTTGVLPEYVGATADSALSVLTNSSEKNKGQDNGSGYDQNVIDKIGGFHAVGMKVMRSSVSPMLSKRIE